MPNERRRRSEVNQPSPVAEDRPSPSITDDAVRNRAYELYEGRGGESGHDWDDWLQAERELRPKREDE